MSIVLAISDRSSSLAGDLIPPRIVTPQPWHSKAIETPAVSSQDSLVVLSEIVPATYGLSAVGDTDHDGYQEIMMVVNSIDSLTLRTLEVQGDGIYRQVLSLANYVYPYAAGDFDGDGKSEIVGQLSFSIDILESASTASHPSTPSWSSPPLSNIIGFATVADTDRDGSLEIIHSINPSRLIIYENTGDDAFTQRYFHSGPFQDHGRKVIGDFDRDGLVEVAVSGHNGHLQIFESPADNTWERVYLESTGLEAAYNLSGGIDSNGNGLPELYLAGTYWPEGSDPTRTIWIYEAVDNNTYVRVGTVYYDDGHISSSYGATAVGDFDANGQPELAIIFFRVLMFCHAVSPNQWIPTPRMIDPSPNGIHSALQVGDLNLNGRPEIFWLSSANTLSSSLVLEHPGTSPADATPFGWQPSRLMIAPNPVRSRASLHLDAHAPTARLLTVLDAAGRLVQRQVLPHEATRTFLWTTLPATPGVYFLRLEDTTGRALATGRATILP
jgi:hypothetical protein